MSEKYSRIPLLVVSCDKYADLWPAFFAVLWKRWPDCPFPVYLGANTLTQDDARVSAALVGPDRSWAENLARMLRVLNTEYVILFLEDFLIRRTVDTAAVCNVIDYCVSQGIACARFTPLAPPTPLPPARLPDFAQLGYVPIFSPYRVSAQVALWRADALRQYLVPGFSAWDFEHIGTQMSRYTNHQFLGPFHPIIDYDHGVEKGRWKPEGIAICRDVGAPIDLSRRTAFTSHELHMHYQTAEARSRLANIKARAVQAFGTGSRREGLHHTLVYLRLKPVALDVAGIALFGLVGRRALAWLQRQHLRLKLLRMRWGFYRS